MTQAPWVSLTAFTDMSEKASADGDVVSPKKYLPKLSPQLHH